jgi:hypothetical protein
VNIDESIIKIVVPLLSNSPGVLMLLALWWTRREQRDEAKLIAARLEKLELLTQKLAARHMSLHPKDTRYILDQSVEPTDEPPTTGTRS